MAASMFVVPGTVNKVLALLFVGFGFGFVVLEKVVLTVVLALLGWATSD